MKLGRYTIPIGQRTCIMGILNITPDSFSDGGKYAEPERAVDKGLEMAANGADIIDIGGESSRPGAEAVTASEEADRILPVVEKLSSEAGVPLSVDTCKSEVARQALSAGAVMVNDIRALRGDKRMASIVAQFGAGVALMHMKGEPGNMQMDPRYGDLIKEISDHLAGSIKIAEDSGIDPEMIIVDPGIGFGKTLQHNLRILKDLEKLKGLGKPLLVGTSRKSFIGKVTSKEVTGREFGTAASVAVAIMNGADMVRVHDVPQMRDVARVVDAIKTGV
ncbi:MAG: dihydropteroate synthase [Candidatus Omnitrophica bacterium]|nr:dihydropteroate synthase [Candidatus Omnitrophota bacterium]